MPDPNPASKSVSLFVRPKDDPNNPAFDWQTAYVWAFIVKFYPQIVGKGGLNTVMDLEFALKVDGHSDVLSFLLQKFCNQIRPASKVDDKSMPKHLTRIIDACLVEPCLSMYHEAPAHPSDPVREPFAAAEEIQYKQSLNPLRQMYAETRDQASGEPSERDKGADDYIGKRFWDMGWKDKLKLIRQLVDWQLTYNPKVRDDIQTHYKLGHQKQTDFKKETNPLIIDPLNQDRNKKRYWVLDSSPRVYTSANPYKKISPFIPLTSDLPALQSLVADLRTASEALAPSDKGPNGEPPTKKQRAARKADAEGKLREVEIAKYLEEVQLPKVEAEIAKQERALKKAHAAAVLAAQADIRSTRTRRSTRRPDYLRGTTADEDFINDYPSDNDDDDEADRGYVSSNSERSSSGIASTRTRRAAASTSAPEWRGERRSTRVQLKALDNVAAPQQQFDSSSYSEDAQTPVGPSSARSSAPPRSPPPPSPPQPQAEPSSRTGAMDVDEELTPFESPSVSSSGASLANGTAAAEGFEGNGTGVGASSREGIGAPTIAAIPAVAATTNGVVSMES